MMTSRTVCVVRLIKYRAVVDGADVHAGGKQAAVVQLRDFFLQCLKRRNRLLILLKQHDSKHDVVLLVASDLAQPRLEAFSDSADIAHSDRCAILLRYDDGPDVFNVCAPGRSDANIDVLIAKLQGNCRPRSHSTTAPRSAPAAA